LDRKKGTWRRKIQKEMELAGKTWLEAIIKNYCPFKTALAGGIFLRGQ